MKLGTWTFKLANLSSKLKIVIGDFKNPRMRSFIQIKSILNLGSPYSIYHNKFINFELRFLIRDLKNLKYWVL